MAAENGELCFEHNGMVDLKNKVCGQRECTTLALLGMYASEQGPCSSDKRQKKLYVSPIAESSLSPAMRARANASSDEISERRVRLERALCDGNRR